MTNFYQRPFRTAAQPYAEVNHNELGVGTLLPHTACTFRHRVINSPLFQDLQQPSVLGAPQSNDPPVCEGTRSRPWLDSVVFVVKKEFPTH